MFERTDTPLQVFVTGATGFVGGAVVRSLLARGHAVRALVRPGRAARLPVGAFPHDGNLRELGSYAPAALECDALVHVAYEYDEQGREVAAADEAAVELLVRAAAAGRRTIYTSNAFLFEASRGLPVTERTPITDAALAARPRIGREQHVCAAGGAAIRVGAVYGGRGGTSGLLLDALADDEACAALDDLHNHWSLIYLHDLAALYCRVLEAGGMGVFHGTDGTPLRVSEVMRQSRAAIAAVRHEPGVHGRAAAAPQLRAYRHVLGRDVVMIPERSWQLGWRPCFGSFREGVACGVREWLEANRGDHEQSPA